MLNIISKEVAEAIIAVIVAVITIAFTFPALAFYAALEAPVIMLSVAFFNWLNKTKEINLPNSLTRSQVREKFKPTLAMIPEFQDKNARYTLFSNSRNKAFLDKEDKSTDDELSTDESSDYTYSSYYTYSSE